MRRISSVGLKGLPLQLISGILFVAAAAVAVMGAATLQGMDLLLSLLLSAAMLLGAATLRCARVTIDVRTTELVIAFRPFLSRRLPLSDVVSVAASPATSLGEGFGYRILGKGQRGLLVGGPSITVRTTSRAWVVSTENPTAVTRILSGQRPDGE